MKIEKIPLDDKCTEVIITLDYDDNEDYHEFINKLFPLLKEYKVEVNTYGFTYDVLWMRNQYMSSLVFYDLDKEGASFSFHLTYHGDVLIFRPDNPSMLCDILLDTAHLSDPLLSLILGKLNEGQFKVEIPSSDKWIYI